MRIRDSNEDPKQGIHMIIMHQLFSANRQSTRYWGYSLLFMHSEQSFEQITLIANVTKEKCEQTFTRIYLLIHEILINVNDVKMTSIINEFI
jgi:hypothetical protein